MYTWYDCNRCGRIHWCLPVAETDGTASTFPEAVAAGIKAAHDAGVAPPGIPYGKGTYRAHVAEVLP